jgi:hypothetical protein
MRFRPALLVALLCVAPALARAAVVVVPNAYANAEAPAAFVGPFATFTTANYPVRYQQVYGAAEFAELAEELLISELRFRMDGPNGDSFPFTVQDVDVRLSTTTAAVDSLAEGSTAALDSNVGSDDTLVYTGMLKWNPCSTAACTSPAPLDLPIPLTTPFTYRPGDGNLLLEVFNMSPIESLPINFFDTADAVGDTTANSREVLLRSDQTTHEFMADSRGLVTQFVYTPEPDALAASLAAVLSVAALRRRARG